MENFRGLSSFVRESAGEEESEAAFHFERVCRLSAMVSAARRTVPRLRCNTASAVCSGSQSQLSCRTAGVTARYNRGFKQHGNGRR